MKRNTHRRKFAGRRLVAEALESRQLLAASLLSNGMWNITGSDASEEIYVGRDASYPSVLIAEINGRVVGQQYARDVARIQIAGLGGNDHLEIDESAGAIGVSAILQGGDGQDVLLGGGAADVLLGGRGNDNLSGAGGHDHLFGGDGDDVLNGGAARTCWTAERALTNSCPTQRTKRTERFAYRPNGSGRPPCGCNGRRAKKSRIGPISRASFAPYRLTNA